MLFSIYPHNIDVRIITKIADLLSNGGVVIVPTDSVYSFACSIEGQKNYDRLLALKNMKKSDATFSLSFFNHSELAKYVDINNATFRFIKRNEQGIFTYIVKTNKNFPQQVLKGRNHFGVKITRHPVLQAILEQLSIPLITASVKDETGECIIDPATIYEMFCDKVDAVVDCGEASDIMSTLIDCTDGDFPILRQGISAPIY